MTKTTKPSRADHSRALLLALFTTIGLLASANPQSANASENPYYVEINLGQSLNGEDSLEANATTLPPGQAQVDYETGFTTGLSAGRAFKSGLRLEAEYLYRSDELGFAEFSDGTRFEEGNFASVTVSANVFYDLPDLLKNSERDLRFYLGAGVGWIQEIDIDLEEPGQKEISFETDDFGYQLMAGVRWKFTPLWALDFEFRSLKASEIELTNESGLVRSSYEPVSLGFSISRSF